MTVLAWDGKTFAADSQGAIGGMRMTARKYATHPETGEIIAFSGSLDYALALVKWYIDGAKSAEWPKFQESDDWVRLVVIDRSGQVKYFERTPVAIPMTDRYMAWGSGREYAMGAMAVGADAEAAVRAAIKHDTSVGGPVDVVRVL